MKNKTIESQSEPTIALDVKNSQFLTPITIILDKNGLRQVSLGAIKEINVLNFKPNRTMCLKPTMFKLYCNVHVVTLSNLVFRQKVFVRSRAMPPRVTFVS